MARVQQGLAKLEKLLQVEPFKIVGLWSNGETRLNDFAKEVEQWKNSSNKGLKKLANPKIFKTAFVKDGTLAFAGSTVQVPGIPGDQPVDFDRRVLYKDSTFIGRVVSLEDAIEHNQKYLTRRSRQTKLYIEARAMIVEHIIKNIGTGFTPLFVIDGKLIEVE